jgi:hypothetical protein
MEFVLHSGHCHGRRPGDRVSDGRLQEMNAIGRFGLGMLLALIALAVAKPVITDEKQFSFAIVVGIFVVLLTWGGKVR